MNEISTITTQLPETLPELAKFALVGREKLIAVRAEIRAIQKVGLAKEVLEQKREEAQEIAELVTLSEVQIGKMLKEIPKATKNHKNLENRPDTNFLTPKSEVQIGKMLKEIPKATKGNGSNQYRKAEIVTEDKNSKPKSEFVRDLGFTPKQTAQFQQMADHEEVVREAIAEAREKDDIVSRSAVMRKIDEEKRETKQKKKEKASFQYEDAPTIPAEEVIEEPTEIIPDGREEMPEFAEVESIPAKKPFVVNNSTDNEWYTPAQYIESAREVMGSINLDPASNDFANQTVKADAYYTEEDDGTQQKWYGNVWLNPPYQTALIVKFAEKLEKKEFEQAIVLVNNASETQWYQKLWRNASAMVGPAGRIRFEKRDGAHGTPLQGQTFFYYGDDPRRFLQVFSKYGMGTIVDASLHG